jgi:hypothetical protein
MSVTPAADNGQMRDVTVTRWTKYGHDRLYVQTADGTRLGYWDNKTDAAVLADEAHRAAFDTALAAHRGASQQPGRSPAVPQQAPPIEPPPPLPAQPESPEAEEARWTDLADIRAGAAAREQALALKQAAPVKTFLARALGVKTDERAWRIGADAEEEVASRLAKLGDGWRSCMPSRSVRTAPTSTTS